MARPPWLAPLLCFALVQVAWMTAVTTWVLWRVAPMQGAGAGGGRAIPLPGLPTPPAPARLASTPAPLFTREGVPLYFETRRKQIEVELRRAIDAAGVVRNTVPNCKILMTTWDDIWKEWLTSAAPSVQGDSAQAADLYFTLLWSFPACHIDIVELRSGVRPADVAEYALIITGYLGITRFAERPGLVPGLRERTFVVDIYGTSEEYTRDVRDYGPFCCTHLPVSHFLSFFPDYAPGNTFLGFLMPGAATCASARPRSKSWYGLVWAKSMEQVDMAMLRELATLLPLRVTFAAPAGLLPAGVEALGLLSQAAFAQALREAAVFVAAGTHVFGPGPIQAVQCGTMLLQPRFTRDYVVRKQLYRGKPSSAYPTSPMPVLERYTTHVETVDYGNRTELAAAVERIRQRYAATAPLEVKPFETGSFVARVRAFAAPLLTVNESARH